MDVRLVAWARAVKARRAGEVPVLWLFTDAQRLPDPLPAIAALPKGLCGVVFRHDCVAGRADLARAVAALCRARHLPLSIAGDWRLAASLKAGVHLRGGVGRIAPFCRLTTASAHGVAEVRRAARRGALVFLSPAFATASHPGEAALGPWRWARLLGHGRAAALGGIDGATVRRLPRGRCLGAGAVAALAPAPFLDAATASTLAL